MRPCCSLNGSERAEGRSMVMLRHTDKEQRGHVDRTCRSCEAAAAVAVDCLDVRPIMSSPSSSSLPSDRCRWRSAAGRPSQNASPCAAGSLSVRRGRLSVLSVGTTWHSLKSDTSRSEITGRPWSILKGGSDAPQIVWASTPCCTDDVSLKRGSRLTPTAAKVRVISAHKFAPTSEVASPAIKKNGALHI